ncbi:hypothetical protein NUW54_g12212 [Trametes sanguinea]|uniref:Uncharacterized protein n=1 Tax=Trametes sanguinea TaxID=158606 RepID=A0ACC1N194_9APHY|nr:hypothetical protein NUW54_g12212 [Trametes sanguinea]
MSTTTRCRCWLPSSPLHVVIIHPSSVNHRKKDMPQSGPIVEKQIIAYMEKRQNISTSQNAEKYLVATTRLDPLTYVLFGAYKISVTSRGLECDGWLPIIGRMDVLDDLERLKVMMEDCMLRVYQGLLASRQRKAQQFKRPLRYEEGREDESGDEGDDDLTNVPLSLIGTRAWMAETGRGAYAVGPIASTGVRAVENELMEADRGPEVRDFVSRILKSRGPKSLLYISFGASMWPKYPEKLWAFLDVVMERRIPFILSHASEFAQIPDDVREKLSWYNLGLLSSWCPQQMILNHPVTGWFLTHCGHCSVMEAISAGVPMICWPFAADGALNAVHLTDTLKCAYELLEVRTGHGLRRVYRTGVRPVGTLDALRSEARAVLEQAFGEDGERRRERALREGI